MKWLVIPLADFYTMELVITDRCTGGGTLRHCDCTGGLVICGPTPNSFVIKTTED